MLHLQRHAHLCGSARITEPSRALELDCIALIVDKRQHITQHLSRVYQEAGICSQSNEIILITWEILSSVQYQFEKGQPCYNTTIPLFVQMRTPRTSSYILADFDHSLCPTLLTTANLLASLSLCVPIWSFRASEQVGHEMRWKMARAVNCSIALQELHFLVDEKPSLEVS